MLNDNGNGVLHGGGPVVPAGWFRFYFADQRWEWSPELERLYGYEPGTAIPTTEIVLSHEDPADREDLVQSLSAARATVDPIIVKHRLIDARGEVHDVVVVGDSVLGDDGTVVGMHGFYVDVTPHDERAVQQSVSHAVADFAVHRAGIEQAKGMLMLVYDITAAAAFDLLKWRSQETNTKLRALADQVVADFQAANSRQSVPTQADYDGLLLTAHVRAAQSDPMPAALRAESA